MHVFAKIEKVRKLLFFLDILKLSIVGFGGPQMHLTLIHAKLVKKRNYITEEELHELNSLCNMLPGPTSTQILTSIGFKMGGPIMAFATLMVWILPATMLMCLFAGTLYHYSIENPKLDFLKYIQPMAVGFVIFAAYKIKNLFVTRKHHWVLMICSAALAIIYHTPFFFPVILFVGGLVSNLLKKTDYTDIHSVKNISWGNFYLFVGVFLLSAIIGALTHWKPILIFENIYRYGSLVFGGGHVLIPMMYNQFVEFKAYLKPDEFLAGVGILQAIPGPVFSFSTFAGAMALKEFGYAGILLGSVIGTIAIFLPGTLLIFFVYPIWNQVKLFSPVKNALEGINATSAGLVIASAYLLFLPVEVNEMNMLVLLSTLFLLLTTKLPYPLIVLICVITGLFF